MQAAPYTRNTSPSQPRSYSNQQPFYNVATSDVRPGFGHPSPNQPYHPTLQHNRPAPIQHGNYGQQPQIHTINHPAGSDNLNMVGQNQGNVLPPRHNSLYSGSQMQRSSPNLLAPHDIRGSQVINTTTTRGYSPAAARPGVTGPITGVTVPPPGVTVPPAGGSTYYPPAGGSTYYPPHTSTSHINYNPPYVSSRSQVGYHPPHASSTSHVNYYPPNTSYYTPPPPTSYSRISYDPYHPGGPHHSQLPLNHHSHSHSPSRISYDPYNYSHYNHSTYHPYSYSHDHYYEHIAGYPEPRPSEHRVSYHPYTRYYTDWEEQVQVKPIQKSRTKYYEKIFQINYVPKAIEEHVVEVQPVEKHHMKVQYVPVERKIIHLPQDQKLYQLANPEKHPELFKRMQDEQKNKNINTSIGQAFGGLLQAGQQKEQQRNNNLLGASERLGQLGSEKKSSNRLQSGGNFKESRVEEVYSSTNGRKDRHTIEVR